MKMREIRHACTFALVSALMTAAMAGVTPLRADAAPPNPPTKPPPGPSIERHPGIERSHRSGADNSGPTRHPNAPGDNNYYGGRVVSNVQVVSAVWGFGPPFGAYPPETAGTAAINMDTFFGGITNSPYLDWLGEYGTNRQAVDGGQGTNQTIGRGTFGGRFVVTPTIMPSLCPVAAGQLPDEVCIDDTQIQAQLTLAIASHELPAPSLDAQGNVNTVYEVFLPQRLSVTINGVTSGVDFCNYHSTAPAAGGLGELYYDVLPANSPGTLVDQHCNYLTTPFEDMTAAASALLLDTITDPELWLSPTTTQARPIGWFWNDPNFDTGEIADLCWYLDPVDVVGADGNTYVVAPGYSELLDDCITRPESRVRFNTTPGTTTVAAGESTSIVVSTSTIGGPDVALNLSADTSDNGLTVSLSPVNVISGQSVTLTVTAAPSLPPDVYDILLDATIVGDGSAPAIPVAVQPALLDVTVTKAVQWRVCWATTSCPHGIASFIANFHTSVPGSRLCRTNAVPATFPYTTLPTVDGHSVAVVDGYVFADAANQEAFLVGLDNRVYHAYVASPGHPTDWSTLGGPPVGIYGAVRTGTNYLGNQEIYTRSDDGQVYHLYSTPGRGSGWQGWDTMGAPSVGISGDVWEGTNYLHNQEVYVLGKDGNVYHKFSTPGVGSGWSNWDPMGHPTGVTPVGDVHIGINSACNQELYVTGSDGNTYHTYSTPGQGSGWSPWSSLGRPSVGSASDVAVGQNDIGNQELFMIATDNTVFHDYATPGIGTGWSGWSSLDAPPGTITSSIVWVDTYPSQKLTVLTTSGQYTKTWNSFNGWGPWTRMADFVVPAP